MVDYRRLRLIGTNGDEVDLRSSTYRVQPGVTLGAANVGVTIDNTLLGRRKRSARHERIISQFDVAVLADTAVDLDDARSRLIAALTANPDNDVLLIVERADGERRAQVGTCVTDDFGVVEGEDDRYAIVPVAIESNERAYWVALEAQIVTTTIGVSSSTPWVGHQPIGASVPIGWPWHIGGRYYADAAASQLILSNVGDMDTWPEWVITGPATSIQLSSEATGKVFAWAGSMVNGDTMRIVTDPKRRAVTINTGSAWGDVALRTRMSELVPGANRTQIAVAGGIADQTTVTASIYPRFVAP